MKKMFTLAIASLFTVALFAAPDNRRPTVMLKSVSNYEIVIDGQRVYTNYDGMTNLSNLRQGRHTIEVFRVVNTGMFRKSRQMVSSSGFIVRNNDVRIAVDHYGKLRITEKIDYGRGNDWNNGRGRDRDRGRDYSRDNDWDYGFQEMERRDRF